MIAAAMCVMLLGTIRQVGDVVAQMRRDEAAIRGGLRLSTGAREQYIHIAHSLIEGDGSHLEHYEGGRLQVVADARAQSEGAPEQLQRRLQSVIDLGSEMDRIFRDVLLPAAEEGRLDEVQGEHRRVEEISRDAATQADAVALAAERRMADAHDEARLAGQRGMAMGGACIAAVLLVAAASTIRLRAAVLQPLAALSRAASLFGRGDFKHRVGDVGTGELAELARAFDTMAEELAAREQKLLSKERMAAIGQLAAGVAHEINNPIGIIRGYIKTMLPETNDPQLREELEVLDEEAAACQRLTGDLLASAERPRLELRLFEMREFLEDASVRVAEGMPSGEHSVIVQAKRGELMADPSRLRQVLANLVVNAAQASPAGASIHVSGGPTDAGGYEFSVIDSGPGVAADDRKQIFEPFVSKRRGGSGLGLAVSRSIVLAHGGSIEVEPAAEGGACFRVVLPAHRTRSNQEEDRA
ncbi:MAG: sensor histidine kinase [Nannocystales bacterium]